MELDIANFKPGGNNLKWKTAFDTLVLEDCFSKSKHVAENKNYYSTILHSLTSNRSVDVLVPESTAYLRKSEFEESDFKESDESDFKQSKESDSNSVVVAINQKPVTIVATERGVVARSNPLSLDLPTMTQQNLEGEIVVKQTYRPDFQAPELSAYQQAYQKAYTDEMKKLMGASGDTVTSTPKQFSVPTSLPPPVPPTVTVQGVPSTNELAKKLKIVRDIGDVPREITQLPRGMTRSGQTFRPIDTPEMGSRVSQETSGQQTPSGATIMKPEFKPDA
jgi:hypothetical protein